MEITVDLPFSLDQLSLLDMHSVLNVLNVVQYELLQIAEAMAYPSEMDALCEETAAVAEALTDHQAAMAHIKAVDDFAAHVLREVTALQIARGLQEDMHYNISVTNLIGIFEILKIRALEILDRADHPTAWQVHETAKLEENFTQMLRAIERNSKGGYQIVTNLAEHEAGDYLVHFDIKSPNGCTVLMPPIFQDVMRDLLANARKYTPPGGVITAGLVDCGEGLRFVVQDTGMGIPEGEQRKVVEFGYRASNAASRQTRGGGFGLTKAFYITKTFGGRMWIDSPVEMGKGTRIEIEIPRP
ncbi:sensor histidine kinase [Kiritimatiellota bacterium B12222]|nr:sensor histidine kinase [Kiritimatiellota bacterium B12222]